MRSSPLRTTLLAAAVVAAFAVFAVSTGPPVHAQPPQLTAITVNAQDAGACATAGACASYPLGANISLGINVSGTFTGTLTVEGSVDGTIWTVLQATKLIDGTQATTITAPGSFTIGNVGLYAIRLRATAWSSGSAVVYGNRGFAAAKSGGGGVTTHNILSATHLDATVASVVRGDLIYGNGTPKWDRLAHGTAGQYLTTDGTDLLYGAIAVTEHMQLRVAQCTNATATSLWDLPTTAAAVAACDTTGSNVLSRGVLTFAHAATQTAFYTAPLASDATNAGNFDINLMWYTGFTGNAVRWSVQTACAVSSDPNDPAFGAASLVTSNEPGVAGEFRNAPFAAVAKSGTCYSSQGPGLIGNGVMLMIKVSRLGSDGADTETNVAKLASVEFTFRRSISQ